MQDLVIFGAGGMAKEVAGILGHGINQGETAYPHIAHAGGDEYF